MTSEMEDLDRINIDNLIWLCKLGFSLDNLSQYFKIDADEVIQALSQTVDIPPKILKRIMISKQNDVLLQNISEEFEVDIACLKTFLSDCKLSIEKREKIGQCLANGFSKDDLKKFLKGTPEFIDDKNFQLPEFTEVQLELSVLNISSRLREEGIHKRLIIANEFYSNGIEIYKSEGSKKEAEELIMNSLNIYEEVLKQNQELAMTFFDFGVILFEIDERENSLSMLTKYKTIYEQFRPNSLELAKIYLELGKKFDHSRNGKAEEMFMKCIEIYKQKHPNSLNLSKIYRELGRIFIRTFKYNKADEMFMNCLEIYEKLLPDLLELSEIYLEFGTFLIRYRNDKAERMFMRYVGIYENLLTNPNDLAKIYLSIGKTLNHYDSGKAADMYRKCICIYEEQELSNALDLANIYFQYGKILIRTRDDSAEAIFFKCIRINEEVLPNSLPLANLYFELGTIFISFRNKRAEEMFIKYIRINEQSYSLTSCFSELEKYFFSNFDKFSAVEEMFMKFISVYEEAIPNSLKLADIYFNRWNFLSLKNLKHTEKAEEMIIKSIGIYEELLPNTLYLAHKYYLYGKSLIHTRDNNAEEMFVKCIRINEEVRPNSLPLANLYYEIGALYFVNFKYNTAEKTIIKSLQCCPLNQINYPKFRRKLLFCYSNLARFHHFVT